MYLLNLLTSLLPARLQPYAKAVIPAAATALAVGAHWAVTGEFNSTEVKTAVEGAVLSLLAFLFPNK